MTRSEHLLTILGEECNEVAKRVSKALRFGLNEKEPGQDYSNAERIGQECCDLLAAIEMLETDGALPLRWFSREAVNAKTAKVEKYLQYSIECGTLAAPPEVQP